MDIEIIKKLIEPTINDNNYILDEVLYLKEDGNDFLRVVIEKNGIIDVDDCVIVSKLINPILDENEELFDSAYILDVCSNIKSLNSSNISCSKKGCE